MTQFALRTTDAAWIARHDGSTDQHGRVHVDVPQVEEVTFGRVPMLRHQFTDVPNDYPNSTVFCPKSWVTGLNARAVWHEAAPATVGRLTAI